MTLLTNEDKRLEECVYFLLLKVTYADCCEIVSTCKSSGVILAIGHVLRYVPEVRKIDELIQSGVLGDVVSIQHTEPVFQVFMRCSDVSDLSIKPRQPPCMRYTYCEITCGNLKILMPQSFTDCVLRLA